METILIYIVGGLVGAICWLIIWLVYFLWYRAHEHVIKHNELEEQKSTLEVEKKELQEKLNPEKPRLIVRPSPEDYNFPLGKVEIFIFNLSNVDLTDCKVILKNLYWINGDRDIPENVPNSKRQFDKGEYFSGPNKDIIDFNGGYALIFIADIQKDQMVFLLKEPYQISDLHYEKDLTFNARETTQHILDVEISGKINGVKIINR